LLKQGFSRRKVNSDGFSSLLRHEIASCEEKAYDSLPLSDAATLLFFKNMQEVLGFANEVSEQCARPQFSTLSLSILTPLSNPPLFQRGWQINPTTQIVHFTNKLDLASKDSIPKKATITSNLQFAKELESIV
jgi:26S proteasome regulatory subunit N12